MTGTRSRLVAVLIGAVTLTGLAPALTAQAHHTTVSCAEPGRWRIVNSEAGVPMTFTTNRGHTGSIPAGGSVYVDYSGTSLTVAGVWANGATSTDTGTGQCTTTTTTTSSTTTTTTTTSTSSTLPPSTTTSSSTSSVSPSTPTSSEPPSTPPTSGSSAPTTSTPTPGTSSPSAPPATSTVPRTVPATPPVVVSPPPSTTNPCETATFDPSSPTAGDCWQLVATR